MLHEEFHEDAPIRPHKVLEKKDNAKTEALMLTEGKHSGIIFSYGAVKFEEDKGQDKLKLKFDYEVHDDGGVLYNKEDFEEELGDFLMELLSEQLIMNGIVYTGGIDENRTDDPEQSDT